MDQALQDLGDYIAAALPDAVREIELEHDELAVLARRHTLGTVFGVSDQRHAGADDVEITALETAGRNHVVNRHVVGQIEPERGRVLPASARVGHLTDHGAIGCHER